MGSSPSISIEVPWATLAMLNLGAQNRRQSHSNIFTKIINQPIPPAECWALPYCLSIKTILPDFYDLPLTLFVTDLTNLASLSPQDDFCSPQGSLRNKKLKKSCVVASYDIIMLAPFLGLGTFVTCSAFLFSVPKIFIFLSFKHCLRLFFRFPPGVY